MHDEETIVDRLIGIYSSANKTAVHLSMVLNKDVSRQVVDKWRKQGYIPYRNGLDIEKATDGKIKAIEVWESAANHRDHMRNK